MKVLSVELDRDRQLPSKVTVDLTIEEAGLLAQRLGKVSPASAREEGLSYEAGSEIWHGLVGLVFNRYWDDGIDGFVRGDDA